MRNVGATIINAERAGVVVPTHGAYAQNETLLFSTLAAPGSANLDLNYPQTYVMRPTGTLAYAAFRDTGGSNYLRVIDTAVGSDFGLSVVSTTFTSQTMRHGLVNEAGTMYLYTAIHDASGVKVRRATLTGTSNPVTVTLADWSGYFGDAYSDTSSLVRRVEAVCPTDGGGVVVAVGTHDFVGDLSTINFYWLPNASTVVTLNALIQMPLTETYSTMRATARHCPHISAIYDTGSGATFVFANDQVRGRAVFFSIQQGVDSMVRPVVPIDPDATALALMPLTVSKFNGVYYLTARFTRSTGPATATTATAFDCYLQSSDCENWSFGERSFYLSSADQRGTLLMRSDSPTTMLYGGNARVLSASATKLQTSNSSQRATLDNYIEGWSLDQVSNGADKATLVISNPPVAGGNGTFTGSAQLKRGTVLYLQSGQSGTNTDVGAYGIDGVQESTTIQGRTTLKITGRDIAAKRLIDTNAPVEMAFDSRKVVEEALASLSGLMVKTPEVDVSANSQDGILYTGLNDPMIAYVDADQSGDALMRATVTFTVSDNYHVGSLGFVFGAADDGTGNVLLVPKTNTWTTYGTATSPKVRKLSLNAVSPGDPNAANTGWNFSPRVNAMWVTNTAGNIRTATVNGTYRTALGFNIGAGTTYDLVARIAGRRVQLFAKAKVNTAAGWSNGAAWALQTEFLFDYQSRKSQSGKDYCGLTLSNDVFVDTTAFAQAVHDDIDTSITDAQELPGFNTYTGKTGGYESSGYQLTNVSGWSGYTAGQYIGVGDNTSTSNKGIHLITSISPSNTINITPNVTGAYANGTQFYIFKQSVADEWAYADSGNKPRTASGTVVSQDPGATRLSTAMRGKALFVDDTNTAFQVRRVRTDGIRHYLLEGNSVNTLGWDDTNPIPVGSFHTSSSDPAQWRMILHHGYLFTGTAATYGLPTTGYMRADNEKLRYQVSTLTKRDGSTTYQWTEIPHWYFTAKTGSAPVSNIYVWWNGTGEVGEDFAQFNAGSLVEILGRNGSDTSKRYYVDSVVDVPSPSAGSTSYIVLSPSYENDLRGADNGYTSGDIVCVSGRGQFNTAKTTHDSTTPIQYCPVDGSGNTPTIKVSRFDCYSGIYQSVEDALKRTAAIAGQRSVTFRNRHTTPTTNATTTLGTSDYTIPITESLSNFCLDARVWIPGNSTNATGTAGITGANALKINFRSYYRLQIQQYATSADINAGQQGQLRIGLQTTSTDISAGTDSLRWLEVVTLPLSDYSLSGSYSGSAPNFTLSNDATRLVDLRVVVQNNRVTVEINAQHVWTFNLDTYVLDTGATLRRDTAGTITVAYTASPPSYTATFRVQELGEELKRAVLRVGASVSSSIDDIAKSRRVRHRATAAGGIEFSRYEVRDDAGTMTENLWQDNWATEDTTQLGHYQVSGDSDEATGEYINETFILAEGYRFGASSASNIITPDQAILEAKLLTNEARESANVRQISGVGMLEIQPEDKVTLAYNGGVTDAVSYPSTVHTVTSVSLTADNTEVKGTYTLRDFV